MIFNSIKLLTRSISTSLPKLPVKPTTTKNFLLTSIALFSTSTTNNLATMAPIQTQTTNAPGEKGEIHHEVVIIGSGPAG